MNKAVEEKIDILDEEKSFLKVITNILFFLFLIFYVIYHVYNGNYNLKNYINKQHLIDQKNISVLNSEKELEFTRNKINNLQDNNLDSDLLDEEIRKNTGYAKKNEIIIYSTDLENMI